MRVNARALSLFILPAFILGCTNKPALSEGHLQTSTPFQTNTEPTAYLPPSPTPISVSSLTFTPAPEAMPRDFSPILYGRKYDANTILTVLGGVQGGEWLTRDQAASQLAGGLEYDVYTFAEEIIQVYGFAPAFSPAYQEYSLRTDVSLDELGMVGVARGWQVRQGDAEELPSENEAYRQIVLDWLKAEGIAAAEPGEVHIYRVDLEADGVDEIFISATHLDGSQHEAKSGDYSILLMRKVVGNEAVTLPIVAEIYGSNKVESAFPAAYSFVNFIDLNQDGVLEVVIDVQRWEADGALVYQIKGQDIIKLF